MDGKRCAWHPSYLAISSVDLVNHISQQDLLIHGIAELLVLGVLAYLQVVSLEGLAHTENKDRKRHLQYGV